MNAVTALASDDDLIAQARIAYFNLNDDTARQPANSSGIAYHKGHRYVLLVNVNGLLAVFRESDTGQLALLDRWPTASS